MKNFAFLAKIDVDTVPTTTSKLRQRFARVSILTKKETKFSLKLTGKKQAWKSQQYYLAISKFILFVLCYEDIEERFDRHIRFVLNTTGTST